MADIEYYSIKEYYGIPLAQGKRLRSQLHIEPNYRSRLWAGVPWQSDVRVSRLGSFGAFSTSESEGCTMQDVFLGSASG